MRFGCWRRWEQLRANANGWESLEARRKSWDGLGLGCRLGRFAAERHWRSLTPRHALRRAQPCLVAESLCALTKNREASIVLASLFLAGAEGLEPSARGFGVDVRTNHRERGRGGATRFPPQAAERAVLVWCCEKIFRAKAEVKLLLLEDLLPRGRTHITRRGPNRCRWLGHGFPLNPKRLCR